MTNIKTTKIQAVILGFDGAVASAITGVFDLFSMAGVSWNRIQHQHVQQHFQVHIASQEGRPIRCNHGLVLQSHYSFEQVIEQLDQIDLIIVPTIGHVIEQTLAANQALIKVLHLAHQHQKTIAGNCTGNFFLAEAGIVQDKAVTTHWGFAEQFQQRYPNVKLHIDRLICRDEEIYSSGGGLAWFDLGLHLIERYCGFDVAMQSARSFVIDYRRDSQLSYSLLHIAKPHQDQLVLNVQRWLDLHLHEQLDLDQLAQHFNVTTRTLIRHFKTALNITPHHYIQSLRIEAARKRLEETEQSLELIIEQVGYRDPSSFRRLFNKKMGMSPLEYRRRFSRRF